MSAQINTEKKLVENYLLQHQLESVINEIVNRCVRDRPKDPFGFLAKAVAEKSTSTKGIINVEAYQVLTGRGNPTLCVEVRTDKGLFEAKVPSRVYDPPFASSQELTTALNALSNTDGPGVEGGSHLEENSGEGQPEGSETSPPESSAGGQGTTGGDPVGANDGSATSPVGTGSDSLNRGTPSAPGGFYTELREVDGTLYEGRGVSNAIEVAKNTFTPRLIGVDPVEQEMVDQILVSLDPSENKENVGSNTCLATSIAVCRAGAMAKGVPLYRHLATLARNSQFVIPVPSFALVTGGKMVDTLNTMAFEQICLLPTGAENFAEALHIGHVVHRALGGLIQLRQKSSGGILQQHYDGSFIVTHVSTVDDVLHLVLQAIEATGLMEKAKLSLIANAESFYLPQRHSYELGFKADADELAKMEQRKKGEEFLQMYRDLLEKYPDIIALEEPFGHADIEAYRNLTEEFGETTQIAGDSMIDGRPLNLAKSVASQSCNSVVIKLSHVCTVTEVIQLCKAAQKDDFGIILSADASESDDDFLSHLAVALQVGVLKSGSPVGGEYISKYNAVARIESQLGEEAFYAADRFREPV